MRFVIFSFTLIILILVGCKKEESPLMPEPVPPPEQEIYEGPGTVINWAGDIENEKGRFGFCFYPYGETPIEKGFRPDDYVYFKASIISCDTIRVDPYYLCYLISIRLDENK